MDNSTQPSQQVPSELPFLVEFAAAYLDGVMEGEHPEIQDKWATIRKYLAQSATASTEDALRAALIHARVFVKKAAKDSIVADAVLSNIDAALSKGDSHE